jgi:hypothetical protein
MTADEIREALRDRKLAVVAERTKLAENTLWRFMNRKVKPHRATLAILEAYLKGSTDGQA